jgi:hypothetical protein
MENTLKTFLEINDLDLLWEARANISLIDSQDEAEIINILDEGKNLQAVANLLMYPELIPERKRFDYIIAGLQNTNFPYVVLVSIVGLQGLSIETLSVETKTWIIKHIISLIRENTGIIAERASVLIADSLWQLDEISASQIIDLLDHTNEVVRHNTLVALIPLVGLENIRAFIDSAVQQQRLSQTGKLMAEEKLSNIVGFTQDNKVDSSKFDLGSLSSALLTYIPNL